MTPEIKIRPIELPLDGFDDLVAEARAEHVAYLDRMKAEWHAGKTRFDQPGEILLGAFDGPVLLGVCGLSIYPYLDNPRVGRLRHLFVAGAGRGKGVGSALVDAILAHAQRHFTVVRLRTDPDIRGAFYASFGFRPIEDENATHQLRFS